MSANQRKRIDHNEGVTGGLSRAADADRRAAEVLHAARRDRSPVASLPEGMRPHDLAEAYAIQAEGLALAGDRLAGFKIGATSRHAQEFLHLDVPFYGSITDKEILDSPATLRLDDFNFCLIEPEFAVRLGADLAPGVAAYGRAEVAAAVAAVHPAIEVVTSAYGDDWVEAGALALIADNGVHGCLVLGPATEDWRGLDLAEHQVTLRRNGIVKGIGHGANALGHPLDALAWLANQAVAGGRGLKAGDIITTGVVTPFLHAEDGDTFVADFGPLGEVRLNMAG
jgi:2-keto-4-pentenoate hydratase